MSELASILSRLDADGQIGIERSRKTDIPGVTAVELYEIGIKIHVAVDANRSLPHDTYLMYATTKAAPPSVDDAAVGSSSFSAPGSSRRQPVMDSRPLVPAGESDAS